MNFKNVGNCRRLSVSALTVTALVGTVCAPANAALITWESAHNITGDSDIRNGGTTVGAFNAGNLNLGSYTINGVQFDPFNYSGSNPTAVGDASMFLYPSPNPNPAHAANVFTNGSTLGGVQYKDMLNSAIYNDVSAITITYDNLIVGHNYLYQTWSTDADLGNNWNGRTVDVSGQGNLTPVTLSYGAGSGALGQYAVGTFTADGTSQSFDYLSGIAPGGSAAYGATVINDFQMRDMGVAPVPEPSTWAMMIVGALGMCVMAFRRKPSSAVALKLNI